MEKVPVESLLLIQPFLPFIACMCVCTFVCVSQGQIYIRNMKLFQSYKNNNLLTSKPVARQPSRRLVRRQIKLRQLKRFRMAWHTARLLKRWLVVLVLFYISSPTCTFHAIAVRHHRDSKNSSLPKFWTGFASNRWRLHGGDGGSIMYAKLA